MPGEVAGTRVCITPGTEPSSVVLRTFVGSREALTQTMVADGQPHAVEDATCRGTLRFDWSTQGRLMSRGDVSCGEEATRHVSGLGLTDGHLSTHLRKLEEAGYIKCLKSFVGRRPRTTYRMLAKGRTAFERHVATLEQVVARHRS